MLTPSTPLAYPQVVSRHFASFRVPRFRRFRRSCPFYERVRFPAAPPGEQTRGTISGLFLLSSTSMPSTVSETAARSTDLPAGCCRVRLRTALRTIFSASTQTSSALPAGDACDHDQCSPQPPLRAGRDSFEWPRARRSPPVLAAIERRRRRDYRRPTRDIAQTLWRVRRAGLRSSLQLSIGTMLAAPGRQHAGRGVRLWARFKA